MSRKVNWDAYTARLVALRGATATDYELLKSLARGSVLDAGCGAGIHLGRLAAFGVQEMVGVDAGMPGLCYGKSNCPNAVFVAANLFQLPFQDNRFDFLYSIDVVEHLERPLAALQEYRRVCKPGGLVFVQTPNYPVKRLYDLWHWLRRSREGLADDPTHVSRFSSFTLKEIVQEAGLRVVSMSARNIAFQKFLPRLGTLRSAWFGYRFGQKVIIVAAKP